MSLDRQSVIGYRVTALPFDAQMDAILKWAQERKSKSVCVANVHMLMEAKSNPLLASALDKADLVTPDGMPLVWMMNLLGRKQHDRVAGMDILLSLCQRSSSQMTSVFFLGSQETILQRIKERLTQEFPDLTIAGMTPLPFRPLTLEEDAAVVQEINNSGAGIVFVSLGCPKQELWIAQHQDQIHAVMIGLGGAFPVYAGIHQWAPEWIRKSGFEWLYRLMQEPRRLWRRYSQTIPPFIVLALRQLLMSWLNLDPPLNIESGEQCH